MGIICKLILQTRVSTYCDVRSEVERNNRDYGPCTELVVEA